MISGTITDASGIAMSGQTAEAFYSALAHAKPAIGLNCALGAEELRPHVEAVNKSNCYIRTPERALELGE